LTPDAEKDLIVAALGGNEEAFEKLYRRYRDRVYSFAHRMSDNRLVAEDIVHEAFLVLIKHPERYDPLRGSILTFLCAIARNQVLNVLRRAGEKRTDLADDPADFTETVDHEGDDPLRNLLRQEMAAKVKEAVQCLPLHYREVILLREYQELSYEQIASVTGADINLVKVRLHRARQTLAKQLNPYLTSKV